MNPFPHEHALREIATINFTRWSDAVKNGSPSEVAQLYSEEATFHPTMSNRFFCGRTEIGIYFEYFLKLRPVPSMLEDMIQVIRPEEWYLHNGIYRFDLDPGNENSHHLKARFTFLYALRDNKWGIIHHHSSLIPQMSKS